jgi:hypothetical protein
MPANKAFKTFELIHNEVMKNIADELISAIARIAMILR